jgi:predicted cupin superfamily sugar epimerase
MKPKEWYQAEIRWAVMVEGKQGLREWEDAIYFFLSEDQDSAFRHALEIGWRERDGREEGRRWVERRLAQIVRLQCLGSNPTEFVVPLGFRKATERLPFEHEFDPEGQVPMVPF